MEIQAVVREEDQSLATRGKVSRDLTQVGCGGGQTSAPAGGRASQLKQKGSRVTFCRLGMAGGQGSIRAHIKSHLVVGGGLLTC